MTEQSHEELEKQRDSERADALASLAAAGSSTPRQPATAAVPQPGAAPAPKTQAAKASAYNRAAKQAHAEGMKRFLFPCMIAAAVLLLLFGSIAVSKLPSEEEKYLYGESWITRPWAPYLVRAAFPLALILAGGAVVLWLDLRRNSSPTTGPTTGGRAGPR